MDRNIIYARVQRSRIAEFAAETYQDIAPAALAGFLGSDFLFALYHSPTKWTAVSESQIDFRCDGAPNRISVSDASSCIHDYLYSQDKGANIEFIEIGPVGVKMWLGSTQTAYALQNILNLLATSSHNDP